MVGNDEPVPVPYVRIPLKHKVADLDEQFQQRPVSWAVYNTQWLGGEDGPLYIFEFTRIQSDMWSRVSGELYLYDTWVEGDPEDKDEEIHILTVSTECDNIEDGFVTIAMWLEDLMEWEKALREAQPCQENQHD